MALRRFRTRLIAYEAVGERLGELPHPLDWSASFPRNDVGSLTLRYSGHAARGELVTRPLTDGLEVAVEVCTDDTPWTEVRGGRFVMLARSWRADDGQRIMTLTGPSYGWLLSKQKILNVNAILAGSHYQAGSWPFYQASAGEVMDALMSDGWQSENQPLTWSFTAAAPTGGGSWDRSETQFYPLGTDHLKVLEKLVGLGLCDWHTQGRELVLTPADGATVDRSDQLALHLGTDVVEAPSSEDLAPVAETVVFRGGTDDVTRVTTGNAPSPWGYWQALRTDERVTVAETADRFVAEAAGEARMRASYGRDLTPTAKALPLVDFHPGDWITAPGAAGMERLRVAECSLRSDGRHVTPAVVLNDRHTDRQLRLARTAREAAEKVDAIAPAAIGPARAVDTDRVTIGDDGFEAWRPGSDPETDAPWLTLDDGHLAAWAPGADPETDAPLFELDEGGSWSVKDATGTELLGADANGWTTTPWGSGGGGGGGIELVTSASFVASPQAFHGTSPENAFYALAETTVDLGAGTLYRVTSDTAAVQWNFPTAADPDAEEEMAFFVLAHPVTPGQTMAQWWTAAQSAGALYPQASLGVATWLHSDRLGNGQNHPRYVNPARSVVVPSNGSYRIALVGSTSPVATRVGYPQFFTGGRRMVVEKLGSATT